MLIHKKTLSWMEQHLPQNDICILLFMYRSNLHRVCISHPIQNLDWRQSRHPLCLDLLYRPIYHYPLLGFTASHAYQRGGKCKHTNLRSIDWTRITYSTLTVFRTFCRHIRSNSIYVHHQPDIFNILHHTNTENTLTKSYRDLD